MGADLLGVESEPWVFKGGLAGEVQVGRFAMPSHVGTWGGTKELHPQSNHFHKYSLYEAAAKPLIFSPKTCTES